MSAESRAREEALEKEHANEMQAAKYETDELYRDRDRLKGELAEAYRNIDSHIRRADELRSELAEARREVDDAKDVIEGMNADFISYQSQLTDANRLIRRAAKDVPRLIQPSPFDLACYAYESRYGVFQETIIDSGSSSQEASMSGAIKNPTVKVKCQRESCDGGINCRCGLARIAAPSLAEARRFIQELAEVNKCGEIDCGDPGCDNCAARRFLAAPSPAESTGVRCQRETCDGGIKCRCGLAKPPGLTTTLPIAGHSQAATPDDIWDVAENVRDVRGALTKTACRLDGRIDATERRLKALEAKVELNAALAKAANQCTEVGLANVAHRIGASPEQARHVFKCKTNPDNVPACTAFCICECGKRHDEHVVSKPKPPAAPQEQAGHAKNCICVVCVPFTGETGAKP